MAGPDYYKILGVSPTSSAGKIKSAYRDLVKKYHPDLFSTSAEKIRANEKLLEINEAYAVLGDAERRREYDERHLAKAKTPRGASTSTPRARSSTTTSTSRPGPSRRASTSNPRPWRNAKREILKRWKPPISRQWAAAVVALVIFAFIAHAAWEKPQAVIVWTLLTETIDEPSQSISGQKSAAPNRIASGNYSSKAQCAGALKQMVKRDEQEGSKSIFDERIGTVAITVQMKDEVALAREYFDAKLKRPYAGAVEKAPIDDQQLLEQATEEAKEFIRKNGVGKRVRNYECRPRQVFKPESWLRRKLKQVGIIS